LRRSVETNATTVQACLKASGITADTQIADLFEDGGDAAHALTRAAHACVSVGFENPCNPRRMSMYVFDHPVGASGRRSAGCRVVVQHRIDNVAFRVALFMEDVGDGPVSPDRRVDG